MANTRTTPIKSAPKTFNKSGGKGGKAAPFEKSGADMDSMGMKEGSKKEEAMDKMQAAAMGKKK